MRQQRYGGVCDARPVAWCTEPPATLKAAPCPTFSYGSRNRFPGGSGDDLVLVHAPSSIRPQSHGLDLVCRARQAPLCGSHVREHQGRCGRRGLIWTITSLHRLRSHFQYSRRGCKIALASHNLRKFRWAHRTVTPAPIKQSFPILTSPARLGPSLPCLFLQSVGWVTQSIRAENPMIVFFSMTMVHSGESAM